MQKLCEARRRGEQDELPLKTRRAPLRHYDIAAGLIWKKGRLLIDQRPPEGLLGGLWEFPGGKRCAGESLESCLQREVREELGVQVKVLRPFITVNHAYTHFKITLHCFECRWVAGRPRAMQCAAWKWVRASELGRYAFPAANLKVIEALRERPGTRRA